MFAYMDDWFIVADTAQQASTAMNTTITLLQSLGLLINYKESQLGPFQQVVYLGTRINFARGTISPPQERITDVVSLARASCSCPGSHPPPNSGSASWE